MQRSLTSKLPHFCARACSDAGNSSRSAPFRRALVLAAPVVLSLCLAPAAKADSYAFSVSGSGITASGTINVSNTGPLGAYTATGITGTFADANNHFSGDIMNLEYAPPPTFNPSPPDLPNTFGAPAFNVAGFSYDDLFWPGGDSPAVCTDAPAFHGGDLDIYGMVFDVAGGYSVDLWSDGVLGGYQIGDASGSTVLSPTSVSGFGYAVNVTATPTPEPGSWLLLGTGLPGLMAALWRRRRSVA